MAYFSISGMTTPLQKYQQDLKREDFLFDAAQQNAVQHLERLYQQFVQDKPVKQGFFDKLLGKRPKPEPLKGLYFWGGVGRGKLIWWTPFMSACRQLASYVSTFIALCIRCIRS